MNIPGIIPAAPGSGAPPPPREQSPTKDQSDGFSNAMDDAGKEGADTTGPDTSPAADNGPGDNGHGDNGHGDNGPGDNRTGDEDRNAEGGSEQSASADEETATSGPAERGTSPEETVDTPSVATSPTPRAADAIDEEQAPRTATQSERPALTSPPASTDPMADGPADAQQQAPVDVDAQTSAVQTSSAAGGTEAVRRHGAAVQLAGCTVVALCSRMDPSGRIRSPRSAFGSSSRGPSIPSRSPNVMSPK